MKLTQATKQVGYSFIWKKIKEDIVTTNSSDQEERELQTNK